MRLLLRYAAPPLLYAGTIFLASSFPTVPGPSLYGKDKVLHFVVYGGLCWLVARALAAYRPAWPSPQVTGLAVVLTTLYGVSDEIHQRFTPGRSPEVADVMADALGALTAGVFWLRRRGKARQPVR